MPVSSTHRDLRLHIERVLCETFLQPIKYRPEMGIVKARKLGVSSKIFCILRQCRFMGMDQLTFAWSCGQLGRQGILFSLYVIATISMVSKLCVTFMKLFPQNSSL